jgi:hypothetical protein
MGGDCVMAGSRPLEAALGVSLASEHLLALSLSEI